MNNYPVNGEFNLIETKDIQLFLPLMKELTEFGERFLCEMLRWCEYGRPDRTSQLMWHFFICLKEAEPVAICGLYRDLETPDHVCWIGWFGVRPVFRRKGLGQLIIKKLKDISIEKGFRELWVYTTQKNKAAINLYQKEGFVIAGVARDLFPNSLFGNFKPTHIIMKCLLMGSFHDRKTKQPEGNTVIRQKKPGIMAIPSSLTVLKTISLGDQSAFIDAIEVRKQTSWLYYFPFLFCFAIARRQTVLWEQIDGSICLYFLRERDDGFRLDLYLPPFPFSASALKYAQERANDFNRNRSCRILWLEEMDRPFVEAAGYSTTFREEEFIYDTKLAMAAEGKPFERLRRKMNQTRKIPEIEIRAFQERDVDACRELLDRWHSRMQDDLGIEVSGYRYTRNSIDHALLFSNDVMKGEIILIGDKLCAFTFGGQVTQTLGSLFVTISDRDIEGLGYYQRHSFLSNNAGLAYFNDSSDVDRQGLSHVKTAFRPITMNKLYRARQIKI